MAKPGNGWELMFYDIATPEEIRVLKEVFYATKNYGGAETYLQNKIRPVWIRRVALAGAER